MVTFWDGLTPEERCVMINALEEGYLHEVIPDHLGEAEEHTVRALIPRFAEVVRRMIDADLIEIRETRRRWDDAPPMNTDEIESALTDPQTWLWSGEAGPQRMVMLMTTDHCDRLLGR